MQKCKLAVIIINIEKTPIMVYKEEKRRYTYTKKVNSDQAVAIVRNITSASEEPCTTSQPPTVRKACSTAAQSLSHAEYALRNREPHLTLKPTAEKQGKKTPENSTHNSIRRGDGISEKGLRSGKDHIEQTLQASTAVEDASVSLHWKRPDMPETIIEGNLQSSQVRRGELPQSTAIEGQAI